jgi:hypothetical protein
MSMKTESGDDDDAEEEDIDIANMEGMMDGNCNSGICEVQ